MRRVIAAIALILLLGMLLNVATAWAAATLFDADSLQTDGDMLDDRWHVTVQHNPLITYTTVVPEMWTMFNDLPGYGADTNFIGPVDDIHDELTQGIEGVAQTATVGWPMPSLYYTRITTDPRMVIHWEYDDHGVLLGGKPFSTVELMPIDVRPLPVAIYWPGLIVNTLLIASVITAVLLLFYANRRQRAAHKRKRSRCIFCGYELHGDTRRCQECGSVTSAALPIVGRFIIGPLTVACIVLLTGCITFLVMFRAYDPTPALHYAAYHSNAQRVAELLATGADPDELILASSDGRRNTKLTPLVAAAANCHLETVQVLLDGGADSSYPIDGAYTALDAALQHECYECARAILDGGFDVNASHRNGATPFLFPAFYGNMDAVKMLLDYGGNPSRDEIALHGAIRFNHDDVVRLLLLHGAQPNHWALSTAVRNGNAEIFDELVACGGDPLTVSTAGDTLLFALDAPDNIPNHDRWQRLLDAGIDVNARNYRGETALSTAASMANTHHAVLFLLRSGADPNITTDVGYGSALHEAIAAQYRLRIILLLAYGADPTAMRDVTWIGDDPLIEKLINDAIERWEAFDEQ